MTSTPHQTATAHLSGQIPGHLTGERADLLETLRKHRALLRGTVEGLTDEQAATQPTVSELSLGGLVKHVAGTEARWADFVVNGPTSAPDIDWAAIDWSNPPAEIVTFQQGFAMGEGETLADLLAAYDDAATHTDALVATHDLDAVQPLPSAPWFEPGVSWSARRVFMHLIAETAQHAGHADILRETIDGRKSMG